ncbi:MAG: DNA-directed RNA polymerase subunit omega [Deltaproteobacteria bacterium]|jgi:DNA-directed RNA polymerase subunit omega|nr:DNA-directed RNA polymerase subunit omega [Deltaproteobacteria bacterium]
MARVTIDDCLKRVDNRFSLIHLAAERARQLKLGAKPLVPNVDNHKDIVLALREIAAGKIDYDNIKNFEPTLTYEEQEENFGANEDQSHSIE